MVSPCLLFEQDLDVPTPHLPQMSHSCVSNGDARDAQSLRCKKATDLILGWISTTSNSLLWHPDQPALGRQLCPPLPAHSKLSPTLMGMLQTSTHPLPPHRGLRNSGTVKGNPFPAKELLLPQQAMSALVTPGNSPLCISNLGCSLRGLSCYNSKNKWFFSKSMILKGCI